MQIVSFVWYVFGMCATTIGAVLGTYEYTNSLPISTLCVDLCTGSSNCHHVVRVVAVSHSPLLVRRLSDEELTGVDGYGKWVGVEESKGGLDGQLEDDTVVIDSIMTGRVGRADGDAGTPKGPRWVFIIRAMAVFVSIV